MTIQQLREKSAASAKALRDLMASTDGKPWTPENQAAYDEHMAIVDECNAQIKRIEAVNKATADERLDNQITDEQRRSERNEGERSPKAIYMKWLRGGDRALNAEDWAIVNTMSTTTDSEGGYTVQDEVAKILIESLKKYGGMREAADVFQTSQGNPLSYPTTDGTSEVGEIVDENASATDADVTFGTVSLNVFKYSSKVVTVPIELLMDSQIDVEALVNRRLGQRLGRITNNHFTTGTGTGQPRGVVTGSAAGRVGASGQTTTVLHADLVKLVHSVDPAYREEGSPRFMMHDDSLRICRELKDSNNRPIFMPGYGFIGQAMPDSLLGYPIQINQSMPVMAASAKSILFGDFSYYKIRDVLLYMLHRFTDSAYAKKGQVGFLAWMRSGGNLTDTAAVKHYQNAAS